MNLMTVLLQGGQPAAQGGLQQYSLLKMMLLIKVAM